MNHILFFESHNYKQRKLYICFYFDALKLTSVSVNYNSKTYKQAEPKSVISIEVIYVFSNLTALF